MHIKVSKFHPDLQEQVRPRRRITRLMRIPGAFRVVDWMRRREVGQNVASLDCSTVWIPSTLDGYAIRTRVYRPQTVDGPLPCLVYYHGGGYVMGVPEGAVRIIQKLIETRPCIVIAPDYRKAKHRPYPGGFQDCYDALLWARDNVGVLKGSGKFIIGGHSAGGGLTAAVALKARDTSDVDIAFQMPFYPMIDHTQPSDPARNIDPPVWDTHLNRLAWRAYLSDVRRGHQALSDYAVPALASSYQGLPPTLTYVGDLDPFFWETQTYVTRLREDGVPLVSNVYEGCYHAFEYIGEGGQIGANARAFAVKHYADFYDRYAASCIE